MLSTLYQKNKHEKSVTTLILENDASLLVHNLMIGLG
jgi:hypothetical protein